MLRSVMCFLKADAQLGPNARIDVTTSICAFLIKVHPGASLS